MVLENSMLSKDKLTYSLKNESIFPLNNDKRYKGLNNNTFTNFDKIKFFLNIWTKN